MPKLTPRKAKAVAKAEAPSFDLLPDGIYRAKLTDVTPVIRPGKDPYWKWKFQVVDGPGKGRVFFENTSLGETSESFLNAMFEAFGVPPTTDTDDMLGEEVLLRLGTTTMQMGRRKGELVNEVEEVLALDADEEVEGDEEDEDEIDDEEDEEFEEDDEESEEEDDEESEEDEPVPPSRGKASRPMNSKPGSAGKRQPDEDDDEVEEEDEDEPAPPRRAAARSSASKPAAASSSTARTKVASAGARPSASGSASASRGTRSTGTSKSAAGKGGKDDVAPF
jgi:hypothetical protein